jgi:outer membrane protein assembly factor BamA
MRPPRPLLLTVVLLSLSTGVATAQDPETRAEALLRAREDKATSLEPPETSRLERVLLDLESGRLFERLLSPPQGLYPKFGSITPGSGFSLGAGYRRQGLFAERADAQVSAAGSVKEYWTIDARLTLPRLARERVSVDVSARRYDYPAEHFFGIGPQSRRSDFVTYGMRNTEVGASAAYRPLRAVRLGGGIAYFTPTIDGGGDREQSIRTRFTDADAPGLDRQADMLRLEGSAELNYREPAGNPRRGGRYALTYQRFDDRDAGHYSFGRVEADLQQYVPLLRGRRVLAFRALASMSDADEGGEVPFYLQRTLGGPDDLRGFRRFRFRDRNLLLLQAEYRWEIFTAVDGAIFYDAGQVAPRVRDLSLRDLESNYGIGFRFGTINGVFLRVEGAFGSSDGKHFIFRFGHVF